MEEAVTFCERTVQELDQVIREVQKRLDTLEIRLNNLSKFAKPPSEAAGDDDSVDEEPPPHY